MKLFVTNLIYSRVIGLQASGRDIDIKDILAYEIAPVPTSMVDDTGDTVEYVYNEFCLTQIKLLYRLYFYIAILISVTNYYDKYESIDP